MNTAGRNDEVNGIIHSIPENQLGLLDSPYFASISKVFVKGFNITCQVGFPAVDVSSPTPIKRGQFGAYGDEDGQMITGH